MIIGGPFDSDPFCRVRDGYLWSDAYGWHLPTNTFMTILPPKQEALGKEFEDILYNNLWDLYISENEESKNVNRT